MENVQIRIFWLWLYTKYNALTILMLKDFIICSYSYLISIGTSSQWDTLIATKRTYHRDVCLWFVLYDFGVHKNNADLFTYSMTITVKWPKLLLVLGTIITSFPGL